jgi:DNA-3-methyladenine glycosylase
MNTHRGTPRPFPDAWFARSALDVAPDLLGCDLVVGPCRGRIVEVEAYLGATDPASHAFRGRTKRNTVMFGRAGHLYVYFVYGMHWCANVVTGPTGDAQAVLVRAVVPIAGLEEMRLRRTSSRPRARTRDLANGPAKLCAAFGIDGGHNGTSVRDGPVQVVRGGDVQAVQTSVRIGVSAGTDFPWRFTATLATDR